MYFKFLSLLSNCIELAIRLWQMYDQLFVDFFLAPVELKTVSFELVQDFLRTITKVYLLFFYSFWFSTSIFILYQHHIIAVQIFVQTCVNGFVPGRRLWFVSQRLPYCIFHSGIWQHFRIECFFCQGWHWHVSSLLSLSAECAFFLLTVLS